MRADCWYSWRAVLLWGLLRLQAGHDLVKETSNDAQLADALVGAFLPDEGYQMRGGGVLLLDGGYSVLLVGHRG